MSEADSAENSVQIADLLRQGLDDYGVGDVDAAVRAWREVLAIDVTNADALDYIDAAGRHDGDHADTASATELDPVVGEAMELAVGGDLEAAYELLGSAAASSLEHSAALDLTRAQLIERYRMELDCDAVPTIKADSSRMQDFNLPPDAGFLLSLVDGMTPVTDLVSLSGMDPFGAFRMLRGLVDTGIVELRS